MKKILLAAVALAALVTQVQAAEKKTPEQGRLRESGRTSSAATLRVS
jgi:opacity protein-like surface antigen